MAVLESDTQASVSTIAKLALLVDHDWERHDEGGEALVLEFLGMVKTIANVEPAIKLRVARHLAWAKTRDLQEVDYPGWTAFVKAFSPWRVSQTRSLVRLAESRLDLIHDAAANNEIEMTVATRAPAALGDDASLEAQREWLRESKRAAEPVRDRRFMQIVSGADMRSVIDARELGEILIGSDASVGVIDRTLIEWHEQLLTNDEIHARARATPPVPDRLGRSLPHRENDPSASLLGPWEEPADIKDCVAKLRATVALFEYRRMVLGMAYVRIRSHALWTSVPGCNSLEALCAHLQIGLRTLQRYAREGESFLRCPALRKEVEDGRLTVERATFVGEHAGTSEESLRGWLDLVRRLGGAEFQHARERDGNFQKEYGAALDMAREVESIVQCKKGSASGSAEPAPAIGAEAEPIADHLLAMEATESIGIAVRDAPNRRSRLPAFLFVPPKLVAAAKYVLAVVVLPAAHGPRRMVEHDRYTCQNPRCRRRTLRVHPHHLHERQHGGTDDPWNIVTLCPSCHLRGIHSDRMWVVRIGDWLVWTWPDHAAVIMHSPVSELRYERRARRTAAA